MRTGPDRLGRVAGQLRSFLCQAGSPWTPPMTRTAIRTTRTVGRTSHWRQWPQSRRRTARSPPQAVGGTRLTSAPGGHDVLALPSIESGPPHARAPRHIPLRFALQHGRNSSAILRACEFRTVSSAPRRMPAQYQSIPVYPQPSQALPPASVACSMPDRRRPERTTHRRCLVSDPVEQPVLWSCLPARVPRPDVPPAPLPAAVLSAESVERPHRLAPKPF